VGRKKKLKKKAWKVFDTLLDEFIDGMRGK
jgi:hypothetical protein